MKKALYIIILGLVIVFGMSTLSLASSPDDNYRQMLVNIDHPLSAEYAPSSLVPLSNYMRAGGNVMVTEETAIAAGAMAEAMKAAGLTDIYGQSGYRSYSVQSTLYNNKINQYRNQGHSFDEAAKLAATVVLPPGASEHQGGLTIDFSTTANGNSLTEDFISTPSGKWLAANSWRYGFVHRYPQEKQSITGVIFEPWHFRFVGEPHAEYMYKNNLCLEEYFQLLQNSGVVTYTSEMGIEYAVFYTDHNNVGHTGSVLIGASRAYPNTDIGYITTTTVPSGIELFDVIGHWGESYIRALSTMEIITGYPNNTFLPEKNITRAELVSLVARVFELLYPEGGISNETKEYIQMLEASVTSPYADVAPGSYYLKPLVIADKSGLLPPGMLQMDGGGMPLFRPDDIVLRREAAQSLAPLFADTQVAISGISLPDVSGSDPALQSAVQLLVDAGILTGDSQGMFNAESDITRAEISAMLYRVLAFFEFFPEMYAQEDQPAQTTAMPSNSGFKLQ